MVPDHLLHTTCKLGDEPSSTDHWAGRMQRRAHAWGRGCKPSEAGGREGRAVPLPDTWPACDSGHCLLLSHSSARNYMAQTPPTTPGPSVPLTAQPRRHTRPFRWGPAAWHHTARPCEGFLNLNNPQAGGIWLPRKPAAGLWPHLHLHAVQAQPVRTKARSGGKRQRAKGWGQPLPPAPSYGGQHPLSLRTCTSMTEQLRCPQGLPDAGLTPTGSPKSCLPDVLSLCHAVGLPTQTLASFQP